MSWQNNDMATWHHDTMAPSCRDAVTQWRHAGVSHDDMMTPWHHDTMTPWHHDTMTPWHHDTMKPRQFSHHKNKMSVSYQDCRLHEAKADESWTDQFFDGSYRQSFGVPRHRRMSYLVYTLVSTYHSHHYRSPQHCFLGRVLELTNKLHFIFCICKHLAISFSGNKLVLKLWEEVILTTAVQCNRDLNLGSKNLKPRTLAIKLSRC